MFFASAHSVSACITWVPNLETIYGMPPLQYLSAMIISKLGYVCLLIDRSADGNVLAELYVGSEIKGVSLYFHY